MELLRDVKAPHASLSHVSSTSYNKVYEAIGESDLQEVIDALATCRDFSIICDEPTNIASTGQAAVIVKTEDSLTAQVEEYFVGFFDLKGRATGQNIAETVIDALTDTCQMPLQDVASNAARTCACIDCKVCSMLCSMPSACCLELSDVVGAHRSALYVATIEV